MRHLHADFINDKRTPTVKNAFMAHSKNNRGPILKSRSSKAKIDAKTPYVDSKQAHFLTFSLQDDSQMEMKKFDKISHKNLNTN